MTSMENYANIKYAGIQQAGELKAPAIPVIAMMQNEIQQEISNLRDHRFSLYRLASKIDEMKVDDETKKTDLDKLTSVSTHLETLSDLLSQLRNENSQLLKIISHLEHLI